MQGGAGSNFASVSLRILGPDLVNAFTLGLSVDLARVWPLDVISIAVAIMGAAWGLRSRSVIARGGWLLPAFVFVPRASAARSECDAPGLHERRI